VLEAARNWPGTGRVVVASSDKAYGVQANLPYTEDSPLQGCHPYDVSKSCADLIAQTYAHTYGLPVAVTRCGNLYGGGDLNWNRLMPGTMRSVLRGEPPVIRSDGSMRRDYIYVPDVVNGYIMLAEALEAKALAGEAFNFGLDAPLRVDELVREIIAISDYPDLEPIIQNRASNEIPEQYLSSEKAGRVLGWEPRNTLAGGLRETLAWYRDFLASGA
jgi:CDP-glucose 4,6-dehydratase